MNKSTEIIRYRLVKDEKQGFVECLPEMMVTSEDDALELVAFCGENETDRLLVYGESLPMDFFDLHTGLAGKILLKLSNYRIFLAAVITPDRIGNGRFYEMVCETNRGREFRVFGNRADAIEWFSSF
jgi:PadR family transcriptional regulator AphA